MTKRALVTGASGAIGSAVAAALAEAGYFVAAVYNASEGPAAALAEKLGAERCAAYRCDISDSAAVKRLFQAAGPVDILVNNAGAAQFSLLAAVTDAEYRRLMGVDLDGCFYCCREAMAHMVHQKWGRIVNIASVWGETGASCEAVYSAAKAGVIGLTKALAKETAPSGITVNCVSPGVIDTPMNARLSAQELAELAAEIPLGRLGTPDEVAQAVMYFIGAEYVTGQLLSVNGGFYM